MPPAHGGDRTTRQQVTVPERKPDYFIGSSGMPTLTSPSVKMHHASASNGDGVRNSKVNKCLYNTAIRNGAAGGPGTTGAIVVGSRRSCKTESDITAIKPSTTGRYSKSPSPSTMAAAAAATLSSAPGCPQMRFGNARGCTDTGRTTGSPPGGWPSSTTSRSSSTSSPSVVVSSSNSQLQKTPCPPPRLLGSRSNVQRTSSTTTASSIRPQEGRLMAGSQQCRYSNLHKQLDNRLTYQRSYDRNIFGYGQRMDQFVLPPLQS